MKKQMKFIMNSVVLSSTILGPQFIFANTLEVTKRGEMIRLLFCHPSLNDDQRVQLVWTGANQGLPLSVTAIKDTFKEGQTCISREISQSAAELAQGKSLEVRPRGYTLNSGVLRTITASEIRGQQAPAQPTVNSNYQVSVTKINNNSQVKVKICGGDLKENEAIQFRVGANGIAQTSRAKKEGNLICVEKEYTLSVLTPLLPGSISIQALRGTTVISSQDVTEVVRGKSEGTQINPGRPVQPVRPTVPTIPSQPGQGGQQPVKPVAPAKPTLDEATATRAGSEASTWVVKYIVESLGRIERIRANFFKGFADVRKQDELAAARLTTEYVLGAQLSENNQSQIIAEGTRSGQSAANQQAAVLAENEVKRRIRATPSGTQPNFTLAAELNFTQVIEAYQGSARYDQPASMDERLRAIDLEIQNELRPLFVRPEGIILAEDFFQKNLQNQGQTLNDFKKDLVENERRRGQNAFRSFRDNKFPSNQTNEYRNRFETIPQTFENALTGQMWFEEGFVQQYNNMIVAEWNKAVLADTLEARRSYTMGVNRYNRLFADFSKKLGEVERANRIYRNSQRAAFAESLDQAYRGHFARIAQQAQSSALIEVLAPNVLVYVSSGDGNQMTLGDTFSVAIKSAANLGGKPDKVQVSVSGQGVVMDQQGSFDIPGFSSMNEEKLFENIARIQQVSTTETDSTIRVVVNLQGQGISSNVRQIEVSVTLEALLKKLASDPQSSYTDRLVQLVHGYLKNEYDANSGSMWGTVYNNETGKLVVERLANFYKQLGDGQKDNLKKHLPKFLEAFNGGVRPGYWTTSRDDFDGAMEILSNVGLKLK